MRFNQNPVQPDPNSIRRSRNAVSLDKYDVEGNTVEWPKMANRSGWMIYPVDDVTEFYCRNRKQTKPKKRVEQRGGYRRRGSGGGGAGTGGGGGAGRRGAQVVAQALQRFLHGDGAVPSVHLRFCLFFFVFCFFFFFFFFFWPSQCVNTTSRGVFGLPDFSSIGSGLPSGFHFPRFPLMWTQSAVSRSTS